MFGLTTQKTMTIKSRPIGYDVTNFKSISLTGTLQRRQEEPIIKERLLLVWRKVDRKSKVNGSMTER